MTVSMDIRRFFNQRPPKLAEESREVTGENPECNSSQEVDPTPTVQRLAIPAMLVELTLLAKASASSKGHYGHRWQHHGISEVEKPNQVFLKNFPAPVFSGKKR